MPWCRTTVSPWRPYHRDYGGVSGQGKEFVNGADKTQCYDAHMATVHPHLAPDPFDKEIEAMLRDPEVIAELDDLHGKLKRGELKMHSNDEARRIVGLPPEGGE